MLGNFIYYYFKNNTPMKYNIIRMMISYTMPNIMYGYFDSFTNK